MTKKTQELYLPLDGQLAQVKIVTGKFSSSQIPAIQVQRLLHDVRIYSPLESHLIEPDK